MGHMQGLVDVTLASEPKKVSSCCIAVAAGSDGNCSRVRNPSHFCFFHLKSKTRGTPNLSDGSVPSASGAWTRAAWSLSLRPAAASSLTAAARPGAGGCGPTQAAAVRVQRPPWARAPGRPPPGRVTQTASTEAWPQCYRPARKPAWGRCTAVVSFNCGGPVETVRPS